MRSILQWMSSAERGGVVGARMTVKEVVRRPWMSQEQHLVSLRTHPRCVRWAGLGSAQKWRQFYVLVEARPVMRARTSSRSPVIPSQCENMPPENTAYLRCGQKGKGARGQWGKTPPLQSAKSRKKFHSVKTRSSNKIGNNRNSEPPQTRERMKLKKPTSRGRGHYKPQHADI